MKAIDIRTELKHLIDAEQDISLLNTVKSLLSQDAGDWWHAITEAERKEIEEGIAQADRGEFISHEDVMKNPRKWH
jgi:predicted transcriptional regulator